MGTTRDKNRYFTKHPETIRHIAVDFALDVGDGETLDSVAWTVEDGLTKQADLPLDGTVSMLRLEGGTEDTTYWAEGLATYTTPHGTRTEVWRIYITVSRRTCE